MAYCNECPHCGANLDPGEHCNCKEVSEEQSSFTKIVYPAPEKQNVG